MLSSAQGQRTSDTRAPGDPWEGKCKVQSLPLILPLEQDTCSVGAGSSLAPVQGTEESELFILSFCWFFFLPLRFHSFLPVGKAGGSLCHPAVTIALTSGDPIHHFIQPLSCVVCWLPSAQLQNSSGDRERRGRSDRVMEKLANTKHGKNEYFSEYFSAWFPLKRPCQI